MSTYDLLIPDLVLMGVPNSLASAHILMIIENTSIENMVMWVLELAGYSHLSRGTNDVAALTFEVSNDPPDIILFDMGLLLASDSSMLEDFHMTMRALGIRAPIIILTTSPDIQYEMKALGYRTLLKPFHIQDLLDAIYAALH